jgi:hypothetical protein
MLRRIVTLIAVGIIATVNADSSDKLDKVQKTLEKIMAKSGIQFNGEFKSEYLSSTISGTGETDSIVVNDSTQRKTESNEFTSVDFDIVARPNDMLSARTIFRLHQNWQNFFSDVANPIFTRWLSIDGNVKDMLSFHVGHFKKKYTPLTLYTPEIEILNEPYIFARQREMAMDEFFLGDNNRVLQGVTIDFDAEIAPIFNEFHASIIGSRLRNIEGDIGNGNKVTSFIQAADFARYFTGLNLDLTFLRGVNLGFTSLYIFDQKNSYRPGSSVDTVSKTTNSQRTGVISLRPGIDISKLAGSEAFSLKLFNESAFSIDDSTRFDSVGVRDGVTQKDYIKENIVGAAINVGLEAALGSAESWNIGITANLIMNDKDYRNDLAQSPCFIGDRMMNVENNLNSPWIYNTFDALYHSVFKFTPSEKTNLWNKSPMMKTSYFRSIYSPDELARLFKADFFDPSVQLVMPYGPATPNRTGVNGTLKAGVLNNGIKVDVLFASLEEKVAEKDSLFEYPIASFSQMGAGVKVDVSKFISMFEHPLEISASIVSSSRNQPAKDELIAENEIVSEFFNAGLYWKMGKRSALLGGLQRIANTMRYDDYSEEIILMNWAAGLEWKVSEGAEVVGSFGQMSRKNPTVEVENAAGEVIGTTEIGGARQNIVDVSLRVKF